MFPVGVFLGMFHWGVGGWFVWVFCQENFVLCCLCSGVGRGCAQGFVSGVYRGGGGGLCSEDCSIIVSIPF